MIMFGWGKKKEAVPLVEKVQIVVSDEAIQVMPKINGTLSSVLAPHASPEPAIPIAQPVTRNSEPTPPTLPTLTGVGTPTASVGATLGLLTEPVASPAKFSRKILWLVAGAVLLLVLVVLTLFLWPRPVPAPVPPPILPPIVIPEPIPPPPTPEPSVTPPVVEQPVTPPGPAPFTFKATPLPSGPDQDQDDLTDAEEILYKTDAKVADTDKDGFPDGLEVANVYSPRRGYKAKITVTPEVSTFYGSGWKFLYPTALRLETKDDGKVVITTATSEAFSLRQETLPQDKPWVTWQKVIYHGNESWWSPDSQIVVLEKDGQAFIWQYETGERAEANFVATFKLLVRSMRWT